MSDADALKEAALIQSMKTGDDQSYQAAVRTYTPGMLAVARFYLDHSSADEIVQDCWVTVIDAIQKFEGRSGLKLYEAHQHKSEDVCNILDVSASNLRVLLHRARQKIFLMVETFQETGEC